ncbi:MAG: hypothetical protein ACRD0K_06695 [Egibacteraceae bacterium]
MTEPEQGARPTTYAEAMQAAAEMAKRQISHVHQSPTSFGKNREADSAAAILDALRQECATVTGNDRWVAANTLAQLADHLREQAQTTRLSGYAHVENRLREQAKTCDRAVEELLGRSATRERAAGMAM